MKRQDARRIGAQAQETIRLRIADYLRRGKGTQAEAADIFQLSLRGVKKIWKQYKEGGRKALLAKKRGPAHHSSRLSKQQVKEITGAIKKGTPDDYGLPYFLWTAGRCAC
ncbi:MAG TPA: helix-turn-helix domain-containing protein [Nitrososphaera sp.]|nr:helix-turn-helix domain-containing protein [Nitrososphaera sp.]